MDKNSVEDWLKTYGVENYTINKDLSVDVIGDVNLWSKGLLEIPVKFESVSGDFSCNNNRLSTLLGCPDSVGRNFFCNDNCLVSLIGCPEFVGGDFYCMFNSLNDSDEFLYSCSNS